MGAGRAAAAGRRSLVSARVTSSGRHVSPRTRAFAFSRAAVANAAKSQPCACPSSAAATSAAVAGRSAGSFASNRCTTAASPSGTSARRLRSAGGGHVLVRRQLVERRPVFGTAKRRGAGKKVVERAAKAIQVGSNIDPAGIGRLFGGGVVGRAEDLTALRQPRVGGIVLQKARQSQVEDLELSGRREEQVGRFNVPMNQAAGVDVLQGDRGLARQLAAVGEGERADGLDESGEVQPLDVVHDQEMNAVDLGRVGGADDVGVIEARDRFHLPGEPGENLGVTPPAGSQHFQRHDALQVGVQRLVHAAHPPPGRASRESDTAPTGGGWATPPPACFLEPQAAGATAAVSEWDRPAGPGSSPRLVGTQPPHCADRREPDGARSRGRGQSHRPGCADWPGRPDRSRGVR